MTGSRRPSSNIVDDIAAILGGVIWLLHTVWLAARPEGCVGSACFEPGRHHRESEDIAWVLLISVTLIAISAVLSAERAGTPGRRTWIAGASLIALGAVLLVLGIVVNAVSPGGSPLWWLHDSDTLGRLLPVAGTLLVGMAIWRRDPDLRWLGGAFLLAALVGFGFNAQDQRTLLSLPVGVAWIALGASASRRRAAARRGAAASARRW